MQQKKRRVPKVQSTPGRQGNAQKKADSTDDQAQKRTDSTDDETGKEKNDDRSKGAGVREAVADCPAMSFVFVCQQINIRNTNQLSWAIN